LIIPIKSFFEYLNWTSVMNQVSFTAARDLILKNIPVLEAERKGSLMALGQTAAEAVAAKINVPDWDASALDGFALKSADIQNADSSHPALLKVIGRITAGQTTSLRVISGMAVRIMTGAPIPPGADCVVGFEDSDAATPIHDRRRPIAILKAVSSGDNIRRAGEQISRGSIVLNQGHTIGPAEIGLLASLGLSEIKVIRRPVIAIIATGNELAKPGRPLAESQIYCGDSSALAAQVTRYGGLPKILSIARDNPAAVRQHLRRGLQSDLIVTTGGSSMGDRDLVKEIMAEMGRFIFTQVEMTPGKSTAFAMLRKEGARGLEPVPHFALSGNPAAAMLSFEALVRPAILKMQGLNANLDFVTAQALQQFSNPGGKTRLVWASLQSKNGAFTAGPAGAGSRGVLLAIAAANGIAVIPPDTKQILAGETIKVIPLHW
jgi:molybdopterin molybdotransferase